MSDDRPFASEDNLDVGETPAIASDDLRLRRWRLALGRAVEPAMQSANVSTALSREEEIMDMALAALYDDTRIPAATLAQSQGKGHAGLGASYPNVARWLADIRQCFPRDVVQVIQGDAMKRRGLSQMLLEPETLANVVPDTSLVATLMALKDLIPSKSKDQVRELVAQLVEQITRELAHDLRQAVKGAINRHLHTQIASLPNTDWQRTIRRNLQHYDRDRKKLLAQRFYFYQNHRNVNEWRVIIDMDQSGSMAQSIIYASVMASIFASIPALDTHVVAFDTEVVNLTESCGNDPVEMLFGVQLGGGTDINKSVGYCAELISDPAKTLFILISDLYEGGVEAALLRRLREMRESGVRVLVLLALSDGGVPSYDKKLAEKIAANDIPCFGCSPTRLPALVAAALRGDDLREFADQSSDSA